MVYKDILYSGRTNLWYAGDRHIFLYLAGIERIGKVYDDAQPKRPWRATITGVREPTIRFLQDFPVGCELLVTNRIVGRPDVFENNDVVGKLTDCRPVEAWIDDLISRDIDDVLVYKMEIACEFEMFPTKDGNDYGAQ